MKFNKMSITFTTISLIAFIIFFFYPHFNQYEMNFQELLMNFYIYTGLIGFIFALISQSQKKFLIILYSLIPFILYGALLLLAYGISGW
ncbi:hypothetical protein [Macrococcus animalis]|uniref:hypothetical protein n=1 Tax=Macrococcus animalis TaxID=3395467 RepID=UPI0039BE2520